LFIYIFPALLLYCRTLRTHIYGQFGFSHSNPVSMYVISVLIIFLYLGPRKYF